jgi:hypothetical protein
VTRYCQAVLRTGMVPLQHKCRWECQLGCMSITPAVAGEVQRKPNAAGTVGAGWGVTSAQAVGFPELTLLLAVFLGGVGSYRSVHAGHWLGAAVVMV